MDKKKLFATTCAPFHYSSLFNNINFTFQQLFNFFRSIFQWHLRTTPQLDQWLADGKILATAHALVSDPSRKKFGAQFKKASKPMFICGPWVERVLNMMGNSLVQPPSISTQYNTFDALTVSGGGEDGDLRSGMSVVHWAHHGRHHYRKRCVQVMMMTIMMTMMDRIIDSFMFLLLLSHELLMIMFGGGEVLGLSHELVNCIRRWQIFLFE